MEDSFESDVIEAGKQESELLITRAAEYTKGHDLASTPIPCKIKIIRAEINGLYAMNITMCLCNIHPLMIF